MTGQTNLADDEIRVFLEDTDDQLELLESALLQLGHGAVDAQSLNEVFRAAHTLKGIARTAGLDRMADLAHALESSLERARQDPGSLPHMLLDLGLRSTDTLRRLRDGAITPEPEVPETAGLVAQLLEFAIPARPTPSRAPTRQPPPAPEPGPAPPIGYWVRVTISTSCPAPAARAYLVFQALGRLGQLTESEPSVEQIQSGTPISQLKCRLISAHSKDDLCGALAGLPETSAVEVEPDDQATSRGWLSWGDEDGSLVEAEPIGEYLRQRRLISAGQLEAALARQAGDNGNRRMLGQTLVEMGVLTQAQLDQALADYIRHLRSTLEGSRETGGPPGGTRPLDQTVRTSVRHLDDLAALVQELSRGTARLAEARAQIIRQSRSKGELADLEAAADEVFRLAERLHAEMALLRMEPIAAVFNRCPRIVHDLAQSLDKAVELVIEGADTEVDRLVLERIREPILHLLSNAVDHGLEAPSARRAAGKPAAGTVWLRARGEQGRVQIEVEDDGAGIDADAVRQVAVGRGIISGELANKLNAFEISRLVFIPGLSTAGSLTKVSGRGVGLDIVRSAVEALQGEVRLESRPGHGTRFILSLPQGLPAPRAPRPGAAASSAGETNSGQIGSKGSK